MKARSIASIVVIASGAMIAGCNMVGGRGWIPQGPGEVAQPKEEPVARAPAPRRAATKPAEEQPAVSPFRASVSDSPAPAPAPRASEPAASSSASSASGGYTQATRYGDLVFVSGQIAIDPRSNQLVGENRIEEQTRQVMENIRAVLESHRLTMANVVSVTVYMKDLAHFRGMDDTYEKFFRTNLPSRSVVEVARLPRGALVEISVIAGR